MTRMKYLGISQLEALATALEEGIKDFAIYDTVLVDTGTNIAALDLDTVTKVAIQKKGGIDKFDFDADMWAQYKQNAHRVRMAFLKLFLQPINIVVTAHAREITLKRNGIEMGQKTVPDFSPKILASINGLSSLIGYMTAFGEGVDEDGSVKYVRKLQVHPTKTIIAKTRIGNLPTVINLPDHLELRRIVDKWQNAGGQLIPEKDAPMEIELDKNETEDASLTGLEI